MPSPREVLPDRTVAREEGLGALRLAESAHATLAFTGWLMAVLGLIVHACGGLHKHMFDTREFWSLVLYGRVATQLIGDDLAGAARQERSTRWRKLLAAALSRRFRNRMSSSAPGSSTARYSTCGSPRRLTEVPGVARLGPGGSNLMGNASP